MEHYIGDAFRVEGKFYKVVGKIQYRNLGTQQTWYEYRVFAPETGEEACYSCGIYKDQNWLTEVQPELSLDGVYLVEEEPVEVVSIRGNAGVQIGARGIFKKYQDAFGKVVRIEKSWDDKKEYLAGYCEGATENPFTENVGAKNQKKKRRGYREKPERTPFQQSMFRFRIILSVLVAVITTLCSIWNLLNVPSAIKYIEKNPEKYIHLHSLISDYDDLADIYLSSESLDNTAIEIIEAIEGKAEEIQQNRDNGDKSIAILTDKEYCLIYKSVNNQVLVQISERKYAFTSDREVFQATEYTTEYYKHFYYTWGYDDDRLNYPDLASPYMMYENSILDVSNNDKFWKYAQKIRERSDRKLFSY